MSAALSTLLRPLADAFAGAARLRRRLYERGSLRCRSLTAPVISVGNLLLGGTGKTPVVAAIARRFRDRGLRVAVLSRGYRRSSRGMVVVSDGKEVRATLAGAGDEALLLARMLPGVAVIVDGDRHRAGRWAERTLGVDVFVLDDGFQHLALRREVDVVLVDRTRDHQALRVLPSGPLREPLEALARADVILATRSHRAPWADLAWIRALNADAPVFDVRTRALALIDRDGEERALASVRDVPTLVFSGIGEPRQFEQDVWDLGARTAGGLRFADHHPYREADLERIEREAAQAGAALAVTTEKDLVRLEGLRPLRIDLVALRIEAEVERADELWRRIDRVVAA